MRSLGVPRTLGGSFTIAFKEGPIARPARPKSMQKHTNRRSFLKSSAVAASAATVGAGLLSKELPAFAQKGQEEHSGRLTPGDAALLRFAAAAEILETDFLVQYNELGGTPNTSEVPGGSGNPAYTAALQMLDADMSQYVHDNTDDEFPHQKGGRVSWVATSAWDLAGIRGASEFVV